MMKPEAAAEALRRSLDSKRQDFTVADAAAASGLSLFDAEQGLHALVSEYRGHLRVTEDGDIVFRFLHGFSKPWETTGALRRAGQAVWRWVSGAARFVVRAWVAVVLLGYAAIFVAVLIALAFGKGEDRGGGERVSGLGLLLFRFLAEALFWTFHPFSPFSVVGGYGYHAYQRHDPRSWAAPQPAEPKFYERIDRFFFGPKEPAPDPTASQRAILAEIRAQKGRVGLADVMRVTGLPRSEVDPMMSRLMLDYGGSVEVSEEGGIAYRFADLRKTATLDLQTSRSAPVWERRVEAAPVTGNTASSDLVIGLINGFNLLISGWVLWTGLTLERLWGLLTSVPLQDLPVPGLPIALGVIPFVFSVFLFLLPLGRLALRGRRERAAARENGRRAVLQAVLENAKTGGTSEAELANRYRFAAGIEPGEKEITREVLALGGDVDLDQVGQDGVRYRFLDLELEAKAVEAEREAASDQEAKIGKVVFSSED